ncbi:ubiquinol-cytochrome c reductase iron-sulfur subunit [Vararia minispora EC-137]|uniref:Ubiquinol-cytochrome c reductase iron-sulfur subunit n=1 Tax=Vararia minispora EC-137 TaxID=1314806 RepID=A0ACB8Q7X7_9AGAM|nr:ubiquinol-cytochrome c reductase iron-sulfur subunit [Vararia minispora EC-137]
MASFVAKKYQTLAPTVRTLASGVPVASGISFRHAPADDHSHGGPRHDTPALFAVRFSGSAKTSYVTSSPTGVFQQRFLHTSVARRDAPQVPDFSHYKAKDDSVNRATSYLMIGAMGVLTASAAKSTVTEFLSTMAASADVLALAKVEVGMSAIAEGTNVIIKWRGKPVFIRHRTPDEIEEARSIDWKTLRDPQSDEERAKNPEWLVMLGVCTHLGCVPIGESGDYGGWFCPCHGSHYDISGRIRKGPAPLNLEVPEYTIDEGEGKIIVG